MTVSIRDARTAAQRPRLDRGGLPRLPRRPVRRAPRACFRRSTSPASRARPARALVRGESALPLVILRAGDPVGFALVERTVTAGPYQYRMTEFFIRREEPPPRARTRGPPASSSPRFQGEWLVAESTRNRGAVAFWRRVIGAWTHGRYRERLGRRRGAPQLHEPGRAARR